jgi:hypothetical protein
MLCKCYVMLCNNYNIYNNDLNNISLYILLKMSILKAFNNQFIEFIEDIQRVFPNDVDILTAKNSAMSIKSVNPKLIIKIWNEYITKKYLNQIESGDISFFITKDYAQDLINNSNSNKITDIINRLREPIKQMTTNEQQNIMKYIQNLTKLTLLYEQ